MNRHVIWWSLKPWDSWFFRNGRPWSAPGGMGLESSFPPPARTVSGAVRRAIATHHGVELDDSRQLSGGSGATSASVNTLLQSLRLVGPLVFVDDEPLYPAPASLGTCEIARDGEFLPRIAQLRPAEVAPTDMGPMLLPTQSRLNVPLDELEDCWITQAGMTSFLSGATPAADTVLDRERIVVSDTRAGLTKDRTRGTAMDKLFYRTRHVRLRRNVHVRVGLALGARALDKGLDRLLPVAGDVRLGGEGRMAHFEAVASPQHAAMPQDGLADVRRFRLYFATDASFASEDGLAGGGADWRRWYKMRTDDITLANKSVRSWVCTPFRASRAGGSSNDAVRFRVYSACTPRVRYAGGFGSTAYRQGPKPMVGLMGAGAVWFCELLDGDSPEAVLPRLDRAQLGTGRELGLGEVCVAYGWGE